MYLLPFPKEGDCAPYFFRYIHQAGPEQPLQRLAQTLSRWVASLPGLSSEQLGFKYAPEKWSVAEVVGHIADTEQIFAYRLLRIARGDSTPLPGFDQDQFAAASAYQGFDGAALFGRLAAVRGMTLNLLHTLAHDVWDRGGFSDGKPLKALAIPFILAGHESHHDVILQQKYGLKLLA